jgi:hypothetical protein
MSNDLAVALYRNRRKSLAGRLADGLVVLDHATSPSLVLNTGSYVRTITTDNTGTIVTTAVFFVVHGGTPTSQPSITNQAKQAIGGSAVVQLVDGGTRPKLLLSLPQPIPSP